MQAWKLGPALAGGNTIVMKVICPAEQQESVMLEASLRRRSSCQIVINITSIVELMVRKH